MKRVFLFLTILLAGISLSTRVLAQASGEEELANQYFQDAEYESALELYDKLYRKDPANQTFVMRAAACYRELFRYPEGIEFLEKAYKKTSYRHNYEFVRADLLERNGQLEASKSVINEVIYKRLESEADFSQAGSFLYQTGKSKLALETYLQGRKKIKSKYIFGLEIADLYAMQQEYGLATDELLNQYFMNPAALNNVSTHILNLVSEASKDPVESILLTAVQKSPNDLGLRNIIYEFYVLTENFMEAFVQVKSIDKVFRENGDRVYDFGITMRNNKDYKLSNKAMDYVIENHPQSAYFFKALTAKSVNSELIAFETIPLDTSALRESVVAYDELLKNFGREPRFFDAIYRKANLSAFYLHDLEGALQELEGILPRGLEPQQRAEANLLMGDIYLMQKEYNKAKLKYSEVAEAYKDGQIGALAKFKEGRMSYFKGDFEIAKARLKTIKDNTSNDISNDAIKLFLLIQDNSGLDTTEVPLQRFAQAQLMVFQLDYDPALASLDSLLFDFPNHSLTDEIYWEKSNIYFQKGNLDEGLAYLDKIITSFPEDIWGDDALYTKAKIYDYTLKDAEKARQLYTEFLFKYEGSLYIVNVRKRLREMRNDRL